MDLFINLSKWESDNKTFLLQEGRSYSYADSAKFIRRLSGYFRDELDGKHEVVPMVIDNSIEFVLIFLSLMGAGKIPYPIQPQCTEEELAGKLYGLDNVTIVVNNSLKNKLTENIPNVLNIIDILKGIDSLKSDSISSIPSDAKFICGTSGTTALPKKVLMQLDRALGNAKAHADSLGLTDQDIILSCMPFHHSFTLITHIYSVISLKATFVVGNSAYPPDISAIILMHKVTYTSFVPALVDLMINNFQYQGFSQPSLTKISIGSAPASTNQLRKYFDYFSNQQIFFTYGQTEAGPRITTLRIDSDDGNKLSTVGQVIGGTRIRIHEPDSNGIGELHVKSTWQTLGYYGDQKNTKNIWSEDGWLMTGDLAKITEDDEVMLCGRNSDLIISGGVNISPSEIEYAINSFDYIEESMVLPVKDKKRGEVPCGFVVASDGIDEKKLINKLRKKLSPIKVPKKIYVVQEISKNKVGKPDRKVMGKRFKSYLEKATEAV